ncbi:TPA: valine--tRNA ligase [Patescibacteria group bacterium]|uniref:Valine--tRNA ligase n=1 Tax=Candidatus Gottesmanbacteria bacterium GW2011_GWA1_43_11 TaxID=1618436 RepID=A0A0G1CJ94_9BACT|nr:MAG: Valine-tRNA ligase [Candidatus Gottesmanbacteria bacterium GW2011_GWA1_43_11]HCS79243.1 valine--tRNA ligase [Patescibacteria group bacterium]
MDKIYNHKTTEDKIYKQWEASGAFNPDHLPNIRNSKLEIRNFCIIMPPPNANDPLHIGHAMFVTVEDILIRYHRMLGEAALWLPGTDHAGIETQYVFEKKLKKDGKSRFDFDRQTLYQMIWDYVQENSEIAVTQLKKLGASADWSRFTFTLDPKIISIVITTFKILHEQGLVYRDLHLINYCTRCGTGYSELEAKHIEQTDPLYFMKYGPFTLATVRPETKFGDTALAVNPQDKRYQKYIGKTVEAEGLLGKFSIRVIADDHIDQKFGTGVAKVTPYHDFNDYDIWQRHKNEMPEPKQVIGFNGKLTSLAGSYAGMTVLDARKKIAGDLKQKGLLEKVDTNYLHTLSVCYRCSRVLEPLPLPQFFLKVKPLTEKALHALDTGTVKIHGAGHDKILKHWLENLKDWNISRQIVWGIRIPVWYEISGERGKGKAGSNLEVTFITKDRKTVQGSVGELLEKYSLDDIKTGLQSLKAPMDAEYVVNIESPGENFLQETDTFDTWFSSGQWPFATLLSSSNSKFKIQNSKLVDGNVHSDFYRYYPTSVMETGYDILPFWVMRMLMLGIHMTGKIPFEHVYLHGLVRDEKGQKMSKSKGNVMNPLDVIEKHGADALRMAFVMSTTAGQDSNTGESKIRGMRNFSNKIWNAGRYVKQVIDGKTPTHNNSMKTKMNKKVDFVEKENKRIGDQAFKETLEAAIKGTTDLLNELKIGLASEFIYGEFWHEFCDKHIEDHKSGKISDRAIIDEFKTYLKLLHPFVPFVTEEVWEKLGEKRLLITENWPKTAM